MLKNGLRKINQICVRVTIESLLEECTSNIEIFSVEKIQFDLIKTITLEFLFNFYKIYFKFHFGWRIFGVEILFSAIYKFHGKSFLNKGAYNSTSLRIYSKIYINCYFKIFSLNINVNVDRRTQTHKTNRIQNDSKKPQNSKLKFNNCFFFFGLCNFSSAVFWVSCTNRILEKTVAI